METINCILKEIVKIHDNDFWVVEDNQDNKQYTVPLTEFEGIKIAKGLPYPFIKQYNPVSKKTFLSPFDSHGYEVGVIYDFEIIDFETRESASGQKNYIIKVKDKDSNIITVKSFEWQTKPTFKNSHLKCEVIGSKNRVPLLMNKDTRHPIFEIGACYEFAVKEFISERSKVSGKENHFFNVIGKDGCSYLVPLLAIQKNNSAKPEKITCEVIILHNQIKLKQVLVKDPFYVDVNQIIEDKNLINKYFSPFINGTNDCPDERKFKEQYQTESAFWIFTYCNKLLPKLFFECIERLDYKSAKQVNNLIILFEEWIIKRGIIKSFSKVSSRKDALKKAEFQLKKSLIIRNVLNLFINDKNAFVTVNSGHYFSLSIAELYYMFRFTDFKSVEESLLIKRFQSLIGNSEEIEQNIFYLKLFERQIAFKKPKRFIKDGKEDFSLIINIDTQFDNKEEQLKYFNWLYCHYLINLIIGERKKSRRLIAEMLREFFYVEQNHNLRLSLIQHAFSILNNINSDLTNDLFLFEESLEVNKAIVETNPNHLNYNESYWELLSKSFRSRQHILVDVVNKTDFGFDILFNGITGFLPTSEVSSSELKRYEFEEIDFTITAKCILLFQDFNFFVATQLDTDDESFSVRNNKLLELKVGTICDGYVRNHKDYGLFVNTVFGDGLLHRNQISSHIWDETRLKKHFPKSKPIKVVVDGIEENGKRLSLSLQKLLNTEFKDEYNAFIDRVDNDFLASFETDESDSDFEDNALQFNTAIQYEKAQCVEQYAISQVDLSYKIDLLLLAKQLHSTVNSARSYLLNIFIQYFQILVLVGKSIENYSINSWHNVKLEAEKMKSGINLKTLNTFPDADKLVYFLDILILFNEKTDESISRLFEYVKQYSNEKANKSLKTIAKIALANNLMISETSEESDFSCKNLKIINSYLNSGVLSLKETESDRLQRELDEKIKYWRRMIMEDEGQNLEFKQTFLVPYIDPQKDSLLKNMTKHEYDSFITKKKKAIKHSAFKTLCAFANTNGGTLMIGVNDKKIITGLEIDYQSLKEPDRDGFGKRFDDEVKTYFGESFSHLLDKTYLMFEEGDVLIITVNPSPEEVFMLRDEEGKESEELYIRKLSSSEQLKGSELAKFIKRKHLEMLKINVGDIK